MPGWIDSVSAAGAIYFTAILGLLKHIEGKESIIGDQVPVDYVSAFILVAAAFCANKDQLEVFHCASSSRNPVSWGKCRELCKDYLSIYGYPEKAIAKSRQFLMFENTFTYNVYHYF